MIAGWRGERADAIERVPTADRGRRRQSPQARRIGTPIKRIGTPIKEGRKDGSPRSSHVLLAQIRRGRRPDAPIGGNTIIGMVATNAALDKACCTRVAQMAQDALARCVYPAHTPVDGDAIFAAATGRHAIETDPGNVGVIGAMAADVLATAIIRGCHAAGTWPLPAANMSR